MSTPRKHGTPRQSATPAGLPPRFTTRKTPKRSPRRTPRKTPQKNGEAVQHDQGEEGITVAIRMRPLNTKESNANRVWRVLPQYNSVTQTTNTGQPLAERVTGRTFFTFDKMFGEETQTTDVYDNVAKGIVESVVSGLNGTIFAYGQTSSGKTFTMQGSGSIEEGYSSGGGGIVHMAANDIFSHVQDKQDRIFLIRASFIEIYNEEVRDLLGENAVLQVREDPRRGVFVNAVEEIVTDFESLLRILFSGEKNRAVAATGMNERSSRSHTIFRITIESRNKTAESDENSMSSSNSSLPVDDDGAVLISTLNLVDLAGSESVRHTGATGERQKEGAKINQSLLTLSRVIVGLGQPNQMHINFRDSKLTRILQPSLSGNARMAVICCATPSELYLEETRSTLMFASRAKLVKTRAQVNEVLDDRSLIKRLQRELAEARRQSAGPGQLEQVKALEKEALNAGTAARDAESKLNKLKSSILNHAVVFRAPSTTTGSTDLDPGSLHEGTGADTNAVTRKRRLSDGNVAVGSSQLATPQKGLGQSATSPRSVPHGQKRAKVVEARPLSPSTELEIVKEAHNVKADMASALEGRIMQMEQKLVDKESSLSEALQTINDLQAAKDEAVQESQQLSSEISSLFTEMQAATLRHENAIAEKDAAIGEVGDKLKAEESSRHTLEESVSTMTTQIESLKDSLRQAEEEAVTEKTRAEEEKSMLDDAISELSKEKSTLVSGLEQSTAEQGTLKQTIAELQSAKEELNGRVDSLSEERVRSAFEVAQVNSEREQLVKEKETHQQQIQDMTAELTLLKATMKDMVEEKSSLADKLNDAHKALGDSKQENQGLVDRVTELMNSVNDRDSSIESLQVRLQDMERDAEGLRNDLASKDSKLEEVTAEVDELSADLKTKTESISDLENVIRDASEKYEKETTSLLERNEELAGKLGRTEQELQDVSSEKCQLQSQVTDLESDLESNTSRVEDLTKILKESEANRIDVETQRADVVEQLEETKVQLEATAAERDELRVEVSNMSSTNAGLEDEVTQLKSAHTLDVEKIQLLSDKLESTTVELDSERNEAEKVLSTLETRTAEREEAQSSLDSVRKDLAAANATIERLESVIADIESERDELKAKVDTLNTDKASAEEKITALEESKTELETRLHESSTQIETLRTEMEAQMGDAAAKDAIHVSKMEELQSAQASLDKAQEKVASLTSSLSDIESERDELRTKLDALTTDKRMADEKITALEESKTELETRLHESSSQIATLRTEMEAQMGDAVVKDAIHVSKMEELQSAQASLDEAQDKVASLTSSLSDIESERDELRTKLDALTIDKGLAVEKITALEDSRAELETGLREAASQIETLRSEIQAQTDDAATKDAVHASKMEELESAQASLDETQATVASLTSTLSDLESERDELRTKLDTLTTDKGSTDEKIMTLEESRAELENRLSEASSQIETLRTEMEAQKVDMDTSLKEARLHAEALQEATEESQKQIESLKSAIVGFEAERDGLKTELESLVADKSNADGKAVALSSSLDESEARLSDALSLISSLRAEKQTLSEDLTARETAHDSCVEKLRGMEVEAKEARDQIETLQEAVTELKSSSVDSREVEALKVKLVDAEEEATELKQLLAAANDSVNEARETALKAEDELDEKDKQLTETANRLSKTEEELRIAVEELSQVEGLTTSAAQDELMKQLEVLREELASTEAKLESERLNRAAAEAELRRELAEEQRALVQEAEDTMTSLKKNVQELTSSLSSAEADVYSLRQEIDDLQDQNKRLETKALEADVLSQSEKRLKEQVSALSEARFALQSELASTKQELVSASKNSDRELDQTIAELNRVKSECYAAKQESIGLKEEMQSLVQEKSSSTREVRLLQDKSTALEETVSNLEDANQELMSRLRKVQQDKENDPRAHETRSLQSRIKELEDLIKRKDRRIEKLEKVKLTKEKIKNIDKIKTERDQFSREAEECRAKLASAERTISELQSKVARVSRDVVATPDGDEMASMKFAKEALETKLRKYAAHCQHLENEKANVIDALKTATGCDLHDGDIAGAVIELCDKYSSLEEECESLVKTEERVSSSLGELNDLREKNSGAAAKLARLTQSEADLTRKLNDAKEKVATLRSERDHLKAIAESERGNAAELETEKSRQVRYLEQENLQLMLDLKNAKKQLKATRAQLDAMRMNVVDDDTEDFGSIAPQALDAPKAGGGQEKSKSADDADPVSPSDKENLHNENIVLSSSKSRGTESATKRRFAGVPRSAKKKRNAAVGLGEAGMVNEDHTGECKQS